MTAKEIYENETGRKCPTNQMAFHEWRIDYFKWLEAKVADHYKKSYIAAHLKNLSDNQINNAK